MKTAIISIIIAIILGVVGLVGYKMFGKHSNPPTIEEAKKYGCFSVFDVAKNMGGPTYVIEKRDGFWKDSNYVMNFSVKQNINGAFVDIPINGSLSFAPSEKGWSDSACTIPR
jgi:hypothetical protein